MNLVQKLIISNPNSWLEILETTYKIKAVRDGNLVSLKYNQIESPMDEPIVCECRGMVVNTDTNTVLAHPYNKFWNLGESRADQIDWSTARVQEKLDGSLMVLHYRDDVWHVASSGHPTAGGSFGSSTAETFSQAFWRMFAELGMISPHGAEGATFMFELCATENRIVVRHDKPRLVVHGARSLVTGNELTRVSLEAIAKRCNWEIVKEYPLSSVAEVMTAVEALDPIQTEGFIVVDAACRRVKIKSPRYVILHHMKGDFTPRRAIELWQTGESEELLTHFPEMVPQILPVHERLDKVAESAYTTWRTHKDSLTRKDFAAAVKGYPWAAVVFLLYKKPDSTIEDAKAIMRGMSVAAVEDLLERIS